MKKKFLFAAAAASALLITMFSSASAQDITINVNGNVIETDTAPIIINERTMVPLRAVSSALNCGVSWDEKYQGITVLGGNGDKLAVCWIGRDRAFALDGYTLSNAYIMDSLPVIQNERTLVPIRALSEMLGAEVNWDEASQTVLITAELPARKMSDEAAANAQDFERGILSKYQAYADYADGKAEKVNVQIGLENGGVINAELYPQLAPDSVKNFVKLAKEGKFDGTIFHRVIKNFMVQGGAFEPNGNQRTSETIKGEFIENNFLNLIPHKRGVLSMARVDKLNDSASNQFFIMHADTSYLDGKYAAFGTVTSGLEYVDAIAETETDENDKPTENHVISYVKVVE